MYNLANNNPQIELDFEVLSPTAITLSSEEINQALELSQKMTSTNRQWQTYINALALFAVEQWLGERADHLRIKREESTIFQPSLANAIAVVANLPVGDFKLCLIPTGSLYDSEVYLPQIVVDLPEYVPHFYVLVEVLEEQESAVISGFISYPDLIKHRQNVNLQPDADWTYPLPLTWFDNEPNRLLLYLRCLEPAAISLPKVNQERPQIDSTMQSQLTTLLPQLQSPESELWQVLTWEQGKILLTNLELLNWVYNLQQQTHKYSVKTSLKDLLKLLTQPALNVGRWLWDELDELAQELSWQLLPNLTPTVAMRSPTEEFQAIISQLQHQGLEIPYQARGAYQDIFLAGITLRLYAVTWHLLSEVDPHLWTLLLILGTASHDALPAHLKLRVSDQTSILLEKEINREQGDAYLFTRVVGNWNEKFLVSVSFRNDIEVNLPPFAFYPVRSL